MRAPTRSLALAATAALLWMAGCASPPDPAAGWTSGRLALRVDSAPGRPSQALSAGFELRGDDRAGELVLLSPLGTQVAAARWSPGLAVLASAEGERRFDSLDALSREALGEALPLAALPDWLAGRPWRGATHTPRADGFDQLGWIVQTAARTEGQIVARRDAPPAVTLRVRLDNSPAP